MVQTTDLAQLRSLQKAIESNLHFQTYLLEPSELISISSLLCELPLGPINLDRNISLTFLPFSENATEEIKLLQFFSILPTSLIKITDEQIKDILLHINHRTALGNFSITSNLEIAFRYVLPISKKKPLNDSEFLEVISLILLTLDMFSVKINSYLNGSAPSKKILEEI